MSQENVEIVRRGLQAFNEGDLDRALRMCDPRVEVRTLLSGTAHGRDQVRAVILEREKEFRGVQYIPEEFIDAGDVVVGIVHISGSGRLSGITEKDFPAAEQLAFVWTLRSGLVIMQEMFSTKAEALEAAGLEE
jgi:ketosteroid isomerase-like protein